MKLQVTLRNHMNPIPTDLYLLPTVCVKNWFSKYHYYHVELLLVEMDDPALLARVGYWQTPCSHD